MNIQTKNHISNLIKEGLLIKMKPRNLETIKCIECGKEFISQKSLKRKFCCKECFYKSLTKNGEYRNFFCNKIKEGVNEK